MEDQQRILPHATLFSGLIVIHRTFTNLIRLLAQSVLNQTSSIENEHEMTRDNQILIQQFQSYDDA
jgi:hypothetical protein